MRRIWGLGDPTAGPGPFTGDALTRPGDDEVVVAVCGPDPAASVPKVHPGPLAAYAGGCDKRLVLTFDLPAAPLPCRLSLRAFAVQGPVPDLEIAVNGHRGLYFPTVQRTDRTGLPGVSAIAGWVDLVVPIPPTWLRPGANRISLTTTSAEPLGDLGAPHPELGPFWGSAIQYVAIALDEVEEADLDADADPSVRLQPLPLYVRTDTGLAELVDVVVTTPTGFTAGELEVAIGEERFERPLDLGGREFGQVRARLRVPEQPGPAPARIRVRLDGHEIATDTEFRPCRKWTLHLLPHVHLDLGYTDFQAKVAEVHTRNLDRVLGILEARPDYAYSVDGSYVVDQFLRTRSAPTRARLTDAISAGRVSVNAFYALFLTGLATLEECFRAGTHAAALRREHGLPIDYANLTDVPSYSGALPTVLGAMGVDAFLGIQNHGRAANADSDTLHLTSPFRWRGPDGSEVLTFFADCYAQLRYFCGYPVSVPGSAQSFSRFVSRFEREDYLPRDLPIVGIYSDNEDLADGEADFVARWSAAYAYPEVRFSTVSDYFAAVRPLQEQLPVVSGDGGSYWEDGVGAGAAIIADYRRAQVALPAAEALAALVGGVDGTLRPAFEDLDRGWEGLVIGCEHTWTSMHAPQHPHGDQTVDQLAWKAHQVAAAGRVATDEARRALSQLGERVTTDGPTLIVANTLGWPRDVEVEVELPPRSRVAGSTEAVTVESLAGVDELPRIRMLVRDVPAFGYRTVPLEGGETPAPPPPVPAIPRDGPLDVRTDRYDLRVEAGRLTSLWSRTLGRELLDPTAAYGLGEVLHVAGGGPGDGGIERSSLHDSDPNLPEPELDIAPAGMQVVDVQRGAVTTTVRLRGAGRTLRDVETELRLRDDDDRVDVVVRFDKEAVLTKESVYVAFPFAAPGATVRYDRQVGWVDPVTDHLPGACNEWFTTLHGVALEDDDVAITWCSADAPLFTLGDVVRGRWPTEASAGGGTVLSWVMNNHWWTNFPPSQEGPIELRYAFRASRTWDVAEATRFGREVRAAPSVGLVGWMDKMDTTPRRLPAAGASLLDVDVPPHVLASVVAARVEPGCVARFQELAGTSGEVAVRHPAGPGAPATLVTALEDDLGPLTADAGGFVRLPVGPYEVVSVRLGRPAPGAPPGTPPPRRTTAASPPAGG